MSTTLLAKPTPRRCIECEFRAFGYCVWDGPRPCPKFDVPEVV